MNDKEIIEEFKIPIEELFSTFKNHLDIKNNNRILFSGKFGIGKTYFLNEFFNDKKENYEVFHLFPVNYQITSNENIIDFLKYDILIELLRKDKDKYIFKNDNNEDVGLIEYIKKDFYMNSFLKNTVSQMIDPIPQIGKILGKPLKTILEFDKKFQEFKKGDSGIIEQFLKNNNTETDCLSQILKNKIINLKNKKKSILILDDLERIDPEHIFRIMNIFSAHLNLQNKEVPNKFGFDKVIIVADIQNLKSIFHYRYGNKTDFNGYFDKFFSEEIFEFKNEEIITKYIDEIISRFQAEDKLSRSLKDRHYFLQKILKDILLKSSKLNGKERLNLRQLLKGIKFQLPALKEGGYKEGFIHTRDQGIPQIINISIKTLISIFGGINIDFISVLRKIRDDISDKEHTTEHLSYCNTLSYYLLKLVSPFKETEDNLGLGWREYSIKIENKMIKSVRRKIIKRGLKTTSYTQTDISKLFFDLLINYVLEKLYEKEIESY